MIRSFVSVLGLVGALAGVAHGGATSPTLVLGSAVPIAAAGVRTVVFEASLDFENAVQTGYGLQLVVFKGTQLVRYPLAGTPAAGESAALADGTLVEAEVPAVLATGSPAGGGARVLSITARTLRIVLPPDFPGGAVTGILAAVLPEHPVLSNPIGFVLP